MEFGVLLRSDTGLRLATKLTGWFLPLPFLAWAGWYRDGRTLKTVFFGLLIAMVVLIAVVSRGGLIRYMASSGSSGPIGREARPIRCACSS